MQKFKKKISRKSFVYTEYYRCKFVRYMREAKVHMNKNAEIRKKYWPETLIK